MKKTSLVAALTIIAVSIIANAPAQKLKAAPYKARANADPLYYYNGADKIYLEEAESLRAWQFATSEAARSAAGASGPAELPAAVKVNLSLHGWLVVEAGKSSGARSSALRSASAHYKIQADRPVYLAPSAGLVRKPVVIPGQIVVKFPSGLSSEARAKLEENYDLTAHEDLLDGVILYDVQGGAASPAAAASAANQLVESGQAEFAHPNFIYQVKRLERSPAAIPEPQFASTANDTYFNQQWYLVNRGWNTIDGMGVPGADISASSAWDFFYSTPGSQGIIVAVIDDGLDQNHEDIQGQWVQGKDFTTSPPDDDPSPAPVDAHGCATSSLVAAASDNGKGITGISNKTNTKVMHVRIFDELGSTTDANIGLAIRWAADNGADILSNSWGGGLESSNITSAVDYAYTTGRGGLGALCFFASGNDYSPLSYPAWLDNVVSVGGSTDQDEHVTYANFGPDLDLVAPTYDAYFFVTGIPAFERTGIWTMDNSGSNGYNSGNVGLGDAAGNYFKWFGGTSAATPIAAGAAALVLQKYPNMTAAQLKTHMMNTADKVPTRATSSDDGFSPFFGTGRINAYQAMDDSPPPPENYGMMSYTIFNDGFDNNDLGWVPQAPWAQTVYKSRTVWADSPVGNYQNNADTSLVSPSIDLSQSIGSTLEMITEYHVEVWPDLSFSIIPWDFVYVQASRNGGGWENLKILTAETRDGNSATGEFVTLRFDMSSYDGEADVHLRFRLTSDESNTFDGIYIDSVSVLSTAGINQANARITDSHAAAAPVWVNSGRDVACLSGADVLRESVVQGRMGKIIARDTGYTQIDLTSTIDVDNFFYIAENGNTRGIRHVDWDGANQSWVLSPAEAPTLSSLGVKPDGSKIAYAQTGNLYTINPDGSNNAMFIESSSWGFNDAANPAYSRAGDVVYFDAEVDPGNRELFAAVNNGSNVVRLTFSVDKSEAHPSPDPSGRFLAYACIMPGAPGANYDIHLMTNLQQALGGGTAESTPIISTSANETAPDWAPLNGDMLAYVRENDIFVYAALPLGAAWPELDQASTYDSSEEGWQPANAEPIFPTTGMQYQNSALAIKGDVFGSFGFWQNPSYIPAVAKGDLYIVRANLTNENPPCEMPQVRLRAAAAGQGQGNVLGLVSTGDCSAMPTTDPRVYELYFTPNDTASGDDFLIALDLLNFDPFDSSSGWVEMDEIEVWRIPESALLDQQAVHEYTFTDSQEGWTFGSAPPLTAPIFDWTGGALVMTATTSVDTFGFWQSGPDIAIDEDRLYRLDFNVNVSDKPDVEKTIYRPRVFLSDSQVYIYQENPVTTVEAVGATLADTFRVYFRPPLTSGNPTAHIAFDLLNFNPFAPTDTQVALEQVTVESFAVPVLEVP